MACIVKNQRLQDILNLINALVADSDLNINNYQDVLDYFQANFPEITPVEIGQALIPVDDIHRDDIEDTIKNTKSRLRTLGSSVKRLNELLDNDIKKKTKGPTNENAAEIAKLVKDIRRLAGTDIVIPPEAYSDIVSRLENLGVLQDAYWNSTGDVRESHIKRAVDNLRQIEKNAKIDQIDGKIKDLDVQLENLNNDNINFEDIENLNTTVRFKGLDKEIAAKELELGEKRIEFDIAMRKARIAKRAEAGILGFRNKGTVKAVELGSMFKETFWEPFRAIKFMADISAWGVQAAPVVYSMMSNINVKEAFKQKRFGAAFADQKALGQIFYNTTARIILDGAKESSKWGKKSNSTLAQELLNEIKRDPAYVIAKKAKLQISESKSLTRSEEVFTSNVINSMPLFGAIKDVSEDTMVSTLNALRMIQFKKFYDMTDGGATLNEYERVAELINKMTGTTADPFKSQFANSLGWMLSAPKLFLSRLHLFTKGLPQSMKGIDLPASLSKRKFVFQTEADRFIFREYMKMARGYAAMTFLVSLIPGIDFEDDPTETHFLRYRAGDLAVDATGGVGTLYRTIMKAGMLTFGVPDGASYSTKDKMNYLKEVQKKDGLNALMTGFIRYKLHPTISGGYQVMTGEDFFGNSFNLVSNKGVAPHLEGIARALLPISFEQAIDEGVELYNGDVNMGQLMASSSLQAIGFNTFRYNDKMANVKVEDYMNDVEHRPRPNYPKFLQNVGGDPTKEYYRDKYRKIWGDILGEMVISRGADTSKISKEQFKELSRLASKQANGQFQVQFGDQFRAAK